MMSDNPFEASHVTADAGTRRKVKQDFGLSLFLTVAALIEGVSAAIALGNQLEGMAGVIVIFLVTPWIALFVCCGYAIRKYGNVTLKSSVSHLVGVTFLSVLISLCGYVCFGMSCSAVNRAMGTLRDVGPRYETINLSMGAGFLSAFTMVAVCLLVIWLLRMLQRPRSE